MIRQLCSQLPAQHGWIQIMIPEILTLQEHTVVVLRVVPGDAVPLLSHDRIAHRFRFQEALK